MTDFKKIDSTAYADDQPLDSFLLVRTAENIKAIREHRGRSITWTPSTIELGTTNIIRPKVSSYRGQERIPFFYFLAENTTQIQVKIRGFSDTNVSSGGTEITLGASVLSIEQFLAGYPLTAATTSNVSGGVTTPTTHTLALDVTDVRRGWCVVFVSVESAQGTPVEITNSGGANGSAIFSGALSNGFVLDATANLGAADAVQHWGVFVAESGAVAKTNTNLPDRKLLYIDYNAARQSGSEYVLHVWPLISGLGVFGAFDGVAGTQQIIAATDALYYRPLGVFCFDSVQILDSGVSLPSRAGRLDAGQPASVMRILPETSRAGALWTDVTRIHHIGPTPNPTETDHTSSAPLNKISASRTLQDASSYLDLCGAIVGAGDNYRYLDTNYVRTRVQLKIMCVLTLPVLSSSSFQRLMEDDPYFYDIDFRVKFDTQNPSATATTTRDFGGYPLQALPTPYYSMFSSSSAPNCYPGLDEFGLSSWQLGFKKTDVSGDEITTHSKRGTFGPHLRGVASIITLDCLDQYQTTTRKLTLQAKLNRLGTNSEAIANNGRQASYKPRLHILSWSVITTPYLDDIDASLVGV